MAIIKGIRKLFRKAINKIFGKPKESAKKTSKAAATLSKPTFEQHNCNGNNYTIAIHNGEGNKIIYQVKMWIPYFLASGVKFCIITRTTCAFKLCTKKYQDIPIYCARTPQDLELLFTKMPVLESIFYTSIVGNNIHAIRFNKFKHIFIGHGDSDKSSSAHKVFKMFDEIWVAGQAHIDRFKRANINMSGVEFKKVGLPQVSELVDIAEEHSWDTRIKEYSILYLPTWEGTYKEQSYSSLSSALQFLPACCQLGVANFGVKLHPSTGTNDPQYESYGKRIVSSLRANNSTTTFYSSALDVESIMASHNIYICDCSAVISLCLAMDSPLFVFIPKNIICTPSEINFSQYAYIFSSADEFITVFQKFIREGDYLAKERAKSRDYFITLAATISNAFMTELQQSRIKKIEEED